MKKRNEPPMSRRVKSWVDKLIDEAHARGGMDTLPGAGTEYGSLALPFQMSYILGR